MNSPTRSTPRAFTLVELLVVVGIIALLISILMPALSRARDHANRVKCLSNLRQIGQAFMMYLNENKGFFPYGSRGNEAYMEDWIAYQQTAPAAGPRTNGTPRTQPGMEYSAIGKYIGAGPDGHINTDVFVCPSDTLSNHKAAFPGGNYPYSYTMNQFLENNAHPWGGNWNLAERPPHVRISMIKNSSGKVMVAEEDFVTINDGLWAPPYHDGVRTSGGMMWGDLLSIYHDSKGAKFPEQSDMRYPIPNWERRGNAAFCDGHAEFVSRRVAHDRRAVLPLEQ